MEGGKDNNIQKANAELGFLITYFFELFALR